MGRAALPFALSQQSGLSQLGGAHALSANVLVDATGAIKRRPGLALATDFYQDEIDPEGIDALHVTTNGRLYAVGGGARKKVYRVTASVNEIAGLKLLGGKRPVIAETEALLALAAGDQVLKVLLADDTISALGTSPSSPPKATHVVAQSARLATNDVVNRGLVFFSGQALGSSYAGHEIWNDGLVSGFFQHEARPDPLEALHENTNELFGFGGTSLQVWLPDGQSVYAPGTTREYGIAAPYSVIKREQAFAWLDHQRRVVLSDGRSAQVISQDIQATLDAMLTVLDAWGFWFFEGVADVLVWVFPTEKRTLVYQVGRGWSEWLGWRGGNWAPTNISAVSGRPLGGERLVGTLDGKLARLTLAAQDDLGELVNAVIRTGFQNQGSDVRKHSQSVTLVLLRGTTNTTPEPVAWLSWRDEPDGPWVRLPVLLGGSNSKECVVRLAGLGTYRRRQWRWEFSAADLELVSAEEEFSVSDS